MTRTLHRRLSMLEKAKPVHGAGSRRRPMGPEGPRVSASRSSARNRRWQCEVAPVSWTPEYLGSRSPQWPRQELGMPGGNCLLSARKAVMLTMPQAIAFESARPGGVDVVAAPWVSITDWRRPRHCHGNRNWQPVTVTMRLGCLNLEGRNHAPQHCLFSVREWSRWRPAGFPSLQEPKESEGR
jgi:hypothetical protein